MKPGILLLAALLHHAATSTTNRTTPRLLRNPFLIDQLSLTCPAHPHPHPPPNQLTLPKALTFQQWKANKHTRPKKLPTPFSQPLPPLPRPNQSQQLPNHHIQHSIPNPPPLVFEPTDDTLFGHAPPSLRNLSRKTSGDAAFNKHQQLLSLNFQDSLPFDIIYQPDPNTGTGNPDDPLSTLSTRTNYASVDCSASIHRASKQSKSPSAILNEKKDKYMLTPCANNKPINPSVKNTSSSPHSSLLHRQSSNFVVFELCDEIEIDSVVLANFEFFSSMFKIISMSVSNIGLEGVHGAEWVHVGYLKTHNIRGFQVFFLKHLKGFYRYVRLDFLTHYGSEYYCPLSLVRIYGLTQIDAYRRDTKLEQDSKVHTEEEQVQPIENQDKPEEDTRFTEQTLNYYPLESSSSDDLDPTHFHQSQNDEKFDHEKAPNETHQSDYVAQTNQKTSSDNSHDNTAGKNSEVAKNTHPVGDQDQTSTQPAPKAVESSLPEATVHNTAGQTGQKQAPKPDYQPSITQEDPEELASSHNNPEPQPASLVNAIIAESTPASNCLPRDSPTVVEPKNDAPQALPQDESQLPSHPQSSTGNKHQLFPDPLPPPPPPPTAPKVVTSSDPQKSSHVSSPKRFNEKVQQPSINVPTPPPPPPPSTSSGSNPQGTESIFGQIMKRLNYLESNHHLLLNYLEEQVLVLDSSGNRLRKKLVEFDHLLKIHIKKQEENKKEIKTIKQELISIERCINVKLEALEGTITFMKRFGLIQFLSILSILIFLGITRTSTRTNKPTSNMTNGVKRNRSRGFCGTNQHQINGSRKTRSFIRFPSSSSPNREYIVSSPSRMKSYHNHKIQSPPSPLIKKTSCSSPPPLLVNSSPKFNHLHHINTHLIHHHHLLSPLKHHSLPPENITPMLP